MNEIEIEIEIGIERSTAQHIMPQQIERCKKPVRISSSLESLSLPDDMEPLENQVAGHMFEHGTVGMIKLKDDLVLKPITKPSCGEREMHFYEQVQKTNDPIFKELKTYLPDYYGTKNVIVNGQEIQCLVLENITKGFQDPCIMDIKIGARTWDPLANHDKIQKESNKYVESRREVGFCIPGFQVRNISDGKLYKHGKDFGKKLNGETIKNALKTFLNCDSILYRPLLIKFLERLTQIQEWSRTQRKLLLFSSSLLFVYDANLMQKLIITNNNNNNNNCIIENDLDNVIQLKIIDFAHVFPNDEQILDSNYVDGIQHLVNIFKYLLTNCNN